MTLVSVVNHESVNLIGAKVLITQVDHQAAQAEPEHRERDGDEGVVAEQRDGQRAGDRQLEHEQAHADAEERGVVAPGGHHAA